MMKSIRLVIAALLLIVTVPVNNSLPGILPTHLANDHLTSVVYSALLSDLPSDLANQYAITDVSTYQDSYYVSVAGLKNIPDNGRWNILDHGVWLGTVRVSIDDQSRGYLVHPTTKRAAPEKETSGYIFPWNEGGQLFMGPYGVHDAWGGLPGWLAVDFVGGSDFPQSATDIVYAATSGNINYICALEADESAVRVDDLLYVHLTDDCPYSYGARYEQGDTICNLVHGDISNLCGNASQDVLHWHLHLGFPPPGPSGGSIKFEKWTLNVVTEEWTSDDGRSTKTVGDWFEAEWIGGEVTDPPEGYTQNFWGWLVTGILGIIMRLTGILPTHAALGIADRITVVASTTIRVVYVLLLTNFDMTIPMLMFGAILLAEVARVAYAVWRIILKMIPTAG